MPRFSVPILFRYIVTEIMVPTGLCLFVFTGILFLARSLKMIDLIVTKNVSAFEIITLFALVIPQFFEMAVPMALLIGTILAFGRLSGDSELIVLRATGISLRQLVAPLMFCAVLGCIVCLLFACVVRPWANYRLAVGLFELAKMRASSGLIEGVFNEFGSLTMYAEKVADNGGRLDRVLIADRRDPEKKRDFIARYGQVISDNDQRTVLVRLFEGSIHEGSGLNYNLTNFDVNNIILQQSELIAEEDARNGKKATEMYVGELLRKRQQVLERQDQPSEPDEANLGKKERNQYARLSVEFHRRLALPISCFLVAFVGMALGVQPNRGGRSWSGAVNMGLGILVITLFYFALAFATALGEQGVVPAWLALWIPDVIFGVLAYFVFRRIETEEWLAVSQALGDWIALVARRIRMRLGADA